MTTTRKLISLSTLVFLLAATVQIAEARPRPRQSSNFEANKTFGLGIMIGAPTAINGKYFLTKDTALDFGVGAYYQYRDNGLHIHGDFLWHPVNLVKTEPFWLPLYFGVGLRAFDHGRNNDHFHMGVRVPLGVSMDFNNVPLDIFFELAFVFDVLVFDRPDDDFRADLGGAIGIRYWFD